MTGELRRKDEKLLSMQRTGNALLVSVSPCKGECKTGKCRGGSDRHFLDGS